MPEQKSPVNERMFRESLNQITGMIEAFHKLRPHMDIFAILKLIVTLVDADITSIEIKDKQ